MSVLISHSKSLISSRWVTYVKTNIPIPSCEPLCQKKKAADQNIIEKTDTIESYYIQHPNTVMQILTLIFRLTSVIQLMPSLILTSRRQEWLSCSSHSVKPTCQLQMLLIPNTHCCSLY